MGHRGVRGNGRLADRWHVRRAYQYAGEPGPGRRLHRKGDPMVRLAVAEDGSGRARAGEGLRRGEKPLSVRLRHWQGALDPGEDQRRPHHTHPRQQAGLPRPRARRQDDLGGVHLRRGERQPRQGTGQARHQGQPRHLVVDPGGQGRIRTIGGGLQRELYLGAGGSDFVAEYDKARGGAPGWARDTSGSTQVVEVMDGKLVIGGHFYAVADQGGDRCGAGRPGDVDQKGNPILNPHGECKTRQGIAAYSFRGALDPDWVPAYSGSYSLVWALHAEGPRLHTGGEFKRVSGVVQNSYARLSPASP